MSHRRPGRPVPTVGVGLAILIAAASVAACDPATARAPAYLPTTTGVVVTREAIGDTLHYTLVDGRTFDVPIATRTLGVQPSAGSLLLSGTQPEAWLAAIPLKPVTTGDPVPPGCYRLEGAAWDDASTVFLHLDDSRGAVEIAVPKAPIWNEPAHRPGSDQLVGTVTCLDAAGRATLRY